MLATVHIATGRTVMTYEPEGLPVGLITGQEDGAGGFAIEHVCVFPGAPSTTLLRMVRHGLDEAWGRGYQHVTFCLPREHRLTTGLAILGARLGFSQYAADQRYRYFVLYRGEK